MMVSHLGLKSRNLMNSLLANHFSRKKSLLMMTNVLFQSRNLYNIGRFRHVQLFLKKTTLLSTLTPPPSSPPPPPPSSSPQNNKNSDSESSKLLSSDEKAEPKKGSFGFSLSRPIEALILKSRLTRDLDLARFLAKASALSVYSLAGMSLLGTFGIDTSPLIAGIGVTGITVGFAVKEIATNFLSGVLLVFNKPFQKGQHLKVMGAAAGQNLEGEVESIDARYVLLRTKDKGLLMIPSVIVYTNPILVSKLEKSQ